MCRSAWTRYSVPSNCYSAAIEVWRRRDAEQ
jgi:hypothetical protein